ncbi:50S ribosomal protein L32 [Mycoplasmopsis synoviae]|uniref:Large ribosomal subunit protein bL32 n=2 Tax=Mycoplasmopsis synoviae TaxID=2109 RepID=RL32_MYCS5|nr:50S ribosomal protein L32 [Mycoplasmopsis synoviae]Q4A6N8.1 RecName: Full=Large ribosomal subunit protein bL32; AltName: Full=50S ribosomal protein L32 [Mycoplasmopsis synoviae 53]AAZ43583.1 50S ribosomal protein L32 [Mycoplasmopsis synoviae 53]AKB10942.1 50S ribosomal protein L32 [Mycoplasmopsis synoviae ATCC 25204]AWL84001.1 50S ribosomal protein L32 [Mycoplasmopsis synoviae]MBD5788750.1 50S ribosomal protein L32 [Mycoplasmopsis synoviae GX11-T]QGL45140.1 50S ribosomal protein L32 [Mycop
MAIVPKRKTSKQRKHKRNTHSALDAQNLVTCKNCTSMIEQHVTCYRCGFYKGKKVAGYTCLNDRVQ